MPIGGIISGIGSLVGGFAGAGNASAAADAQKEAARIASETQLKMFNQLQTNLQPYMEGGLTGLNALKQALFGGPNGYGELGSLLTPASTVFGSAPTYQITDPNGPNYFQGSPGYQWQLGQGMDAIQNSAAGRTGAISGNMLKALQTYGTGLANQDWYNANNLLTNRWLNNTNLFNQNKQQGFNFLNALTGQGQSAAAGVGAAGIQTGQGIANNQIGAGNAQAAGIVGAGNALTSGINGFLAPNAAGGSISNFLNSLFSGGSTNGLSEVGNPGTYYF